jgi:hypothetical protein
VVTVIAALPSTNDLRMRQRQRTPAQLGQRARHLHPGRARTWAWRLIPLSDGQTRLITRMHTVYEWRRPLTPFTVMLMELADYPMMRRMLRGIRERAEAQH